MPTIKQSQFRRNPGTQLNPVESAMPAATVPSLMQGPPPPKDPEALSPLMVSPLPADMAGLDGNARQFYGRPGFLPQRIMVPNIL